MQTMIVVVAAESAEEHFLGIGLVVAVGVGVENRVRRAGHQDSAGAEHADPERRYQVFVLDEDFAGIADSVAVGVLEDHDSVARGMLEAGIAPIPAPIVDRFGDPEATALVEVHGGRVV